MEAVCRVSSPPRSFSLDPRQRTPLQRSKNIALLSITLLWILPQQPWQPPHTLQHLSVAARNCRPTPLRNPPQHLPHTTKDKAASTTAKYLEARTITTAAQGGVKTTHGTQTRLLCPTVIAIPALRPHHCRHDRCETTLHQRRTLTIAIVTHHSLVAQAQ